uniref:Cytochrome P450 n=2 Tax=Oryza brachyantha TaxID=4533 RepID=J3LQK6_ORYBR
MDDIIRERTAAGTGDGGDGDGDGEEDLLGVLLRLQKNGGVQFPLSTDMIATIIMEIFSAGSETASTTLEWAMSELVKNPPVMEKAQVELRKMFKGQDRLTGDDMGKLSYLHLVIRETLRLHAPAPFLLPRECREPCNIKGYDIHEGTRVLVNAWAIARDPIYWEDAEVFKSERFMTNLVDFIGNNFQYIPFGAGRRICPGITLGLTSMELMLASLLYHFDWGLPGGKRSEEMDITEVLGITVRKKAKLMLHATPRIPYLH